jgi:hypothetical protein
MRDALIWPTDSAGAAARTQGTERLRGTHAGDWHNPTTCRGVGVLVGKGGQFFDPDPQNPNRWLCHASPSRPRLLAQQFPDALSHIVGQSLHGEEMAQIAGGAFNCTPNRRHGFIIFNRPIADEGNPIYWLGPFEIEL